MEAGCGDEINRSLTITFLACRFGFLCPPTSVTHAFKLTLLREIVRNFYPPKGRRMLSSSLSGRHQSRRYFLKATGVTIALPMLESLIPRSAYASGIQADPVRMVCIGNSFGMYQPEFFPTQAGRDYQMPSLLTPLTPHRDQMTVFSHLDHGIKGGHFAVHSFLSGVTMSDAKGMPDGNISLDQRAAEAIGSTTRFPTLTLGCESGLHGGCQMSWTRSGVRVPPISGPRELFTKMFLEESGSGKLMMEKKFQMQGSVLDTILEDAKALEKQLGQRDKQKFDEYLASVRDVEIKLTQEKHWNGVSKPTATIKEPTNQGIVDDLPIFYDLIAIALQTDSTRIATLEVSSDGFDPKALGVSNGYHALSHHGQRQEKINDLLKIEAYQVQQFSRFLEKLKSVQDPIAGGDLLSNTMVLFGSGMGNANAHTNNDLPIILAGGGFRHGEHKIYPEQKNRRTPLSNLYVSMLQRFGVQTDSFATSTGTLTGLELA